MRDDKPGVFVMIVVLSALTNLAIILYFISIYRAVTVSPGRIPRCAPWNNIDEKEAKNLAESKRSGGLRFCRWCRSMKPDRAHHCRVCDACTLKMDHHCPWLDNCIGFGNHKFFLLTLWYSSVSLLLMSASCGWLGYYLMHSTSLLGVDMGRLVIGVLVSAVAGLVGLLISAFFGIHVSLILRGVTTLEVFEKNRGGNDECGLLCCEMKDPVTRKRGRNTYQLPSCIENIKAAVGDDAWFWFIPTMPLRKTGSPDGLHYQLSAHLDRKAVEEGADSPLLPGIHDTT